MKTEELNRNNVRVVTEDKCNHMAGNRHWNGPNFIKDQVFSSFKTQIHAFRFVTCIHGVTLPFHNSPKVIYWIEIWCLCRPFEYHEVIVMFKKPLWDDLSFDTWFQYPAEAAIRWWYIVVIKGQTWPWCLKESLLWCPNTTSSLSDTHTHTHYLKTLNSTSILSDLFHRATWKHILQNTIEAKNPHSPPTVLHL